MQVGLGYLGYDGLGLKWQRKNNENDGFGLKPNGPKSGLGMTLDIWAQKQNNNKSNKRK